MGILDDIVNRIIGKKCERLVKQTGQEITVTGINVGLGSYSIALGGASNKIIQYYQVPQVMVTLDNQQYLFCSTIAELKDGKLKENCIKMRLQTILGLGQLQALTTLNEDKFKDQIAQWAEMMNKLTEINIRVLSPGQDLPPAHISGGGGGGHHLPVAYPDEISDLSRIRKYQGISDAELDNAVKILK
jgi:hypothetical protein